mgnify:CR=1 FL=1
MRNLKFKADGKVKNDEKDLAKKLKNKKDTKNEKGSKKIHAD